MKTSPNLYDGLMAQIGARTARLEQALLLTSPQTKRQFSKLAKEIDSLIKNFTETGNITDTNLQKLMALTERLEALEGKFLSIEHAALMSPQDLRRYLYTEEPLNPNTTYRASLPGFGEVAVQFSKEVAKVFNQPGPIRNLGFPIIFNGLVGKTGKDGIKELTGEHNRKAKDDIEYRLVELKNIGSDYRILIVHTSEGILHFYKYIGNHHRVDYIAKGDFLGSFLRSHLSTEGE